MHYSPAELKQFWKTIEKLRRTAGLKHSDIAELLMISDRHYQTRHDLKRPPHVHGVLSLTRHFDLDPRKLLQGNVDWLVLEKRLKGDVDAIPDRYSVAAYSRRRTSIHALSYLERTMGKTYVYDVLRKFDLTEAAFSNPDAYINIQFMTDLCDYLEKLGTTKEQFITMGYESARVNKNIGFSRNILEGLKVKDVYGFLVGNLLGYFEKNCGYSLDSLKETHCVVHAKPNEEVANALKTNKLGSFATCQVKSGVGASFPMSFGLPPATVRETRCIHNGDPYCAFAFNFELAAHMQKKHVRPVPHLS
jgi:hypothetical protein